MTPLQVIQDPPANGPVNMQRDLNLLENLEDQLIIRHYQWEPNWISYGYFQTEENAKAQFKTTALNFVKRPTGGGLVDHRHDLTYTLFIPKAHPWAKLSRLDCYLCLHKIVHQALIHDDMNAQLIAKETGNGPICFQHPVPGDIVNPITGKKLAGAAQRRTRHGLLHQGSIIAPNLQPTTLLKVFKDAAL